MQDRLKQVGRRKPAEIEQASVWLGEFPRDDDAIGPLLHVAWAVHPGLQKHADGRRTRRPPFAYLSERVESSNDGSNSAVNAAVRIDITAIGRRAESNRSRPPDGKHSP